MDHLPPQLKEVAEGLQWDQQWRNNWEPVTQEHSHPRMLEIRDSVPHLKA